MYDRVEQQLWRHARVRISVGKSMCICVALHHEVLCVCLLAALSDASHVLPRYTLNDKVSTLCNGAEPCHTAAFTGSPCCASLSSTSGFEPSL